MAQLKIPVNAFSLTCYATCATTEIYKYPDETSDEAYYIDVDNTVHHAPEMASKTVVFPLDIPRGATITSAKVYATLGSPLYGAQTSRIGGITAPVGDTTSVDVTIADGDQCRCAFPVLV